MCGRGSICAALVCIVCVAVNASARSQVQLNLGMRGAGAQYVQHVSMLYVPPSVPVQRWHAWGSVLICAARVCVVCCLLFAVCC